MYSTHNKGNIKSSTYIDFNRENNKERVLNLKLAIMSEYQNIKTFLQKIKVFVIKKVQNTVLWTYVISDLQGQEIVGSFYKKELKNQIKKSLELKK